MSIRVLFVAIAISRSLDCLGQEEEKKSPFNLTGYAEVYYLYDFNRPENHTRPSFVYSYNRSNEFNLNLGFIKAAYVAKNVRANFALMAGTYTNANLKNETSVLRNIFEANAGVKLSKNRELWVDAGIFASHIGFENAIGKDSWNLTRSLLADNSPYFETGAKISYTTSNGNWFLSALVLNGWQRIQMIEGNSLPSFGTQVIFKPYDGITLNSGSFIGTDKPDSARQMRYFHNFYAILELSNTISATVGFDNGLEERAEGSGYSAWYSPVVIVRTKVSEKFSFDVRGEYYNDRHNVIIKTEPAQAFKTLGFSMNLDYVIAANALWRIEVRHLSSSEKVFVRKGRFVSDNSFVTTSLAVSF